MFHSTTISSLASHLETLLVAIDGISNVLQDFRSERGSVHSRTSTLEPAIRLREAVLSLEQIHPLFIERVNQLDAILDKIKYGRSFLSSINCLPDEILSDIFTLIPVHREEEHINNAVVVSSVCRRWRDVATTSSSLWNTLSLGSNIHRNLTELCLLRSGHRGLRVTMLCQDDADFDAIEFPAAHRWYDWTLHVENASSTARIISSYLGTLQRNPLDISCLRSLTLAPFSFPYPNIDLYGDFDIHPDSIRMSVQVKG